MITTLRTKMLIGVTPLLALMVGLGLWAITLFSRLGNNIDVILRENYRSVLAAEGMKEALERMDSALLVRHRRQGGPGPRRSSATSRKAFERKLKVEQNNVTLPGEQEMADDLTALHARYVAQADRFFALPPERARPSGPASTSSGSCRCSTRSSGGPTTCWRSTRRTWRTSATGPARRPRRRPG